MKSKTKSQTTNSYAFKEPPTTAADTEYKAAIDNMANTPDPNIGFQAGVARQRLGDRFDNPWGQDYSPEVRDAVNYAGNQEIDQATGLALRQDRKDRSDTSLLHRAAYAGSKAPQLVQTGGTFQGTQTQPVGPALIGAVGQAAGGFLS